MSLRLVSFSRLPLKVSGESFHPFNKAVSGLPPYAPLARASYRGENCRSSPRSGLSDRAPRAAATAPPPELRKGYSTPELRASTPARNRPWNVQGAPAPCQVVPRPPSAGASVPQCRMSRRTAAGTRRGVFMLDVLNYNSASRPAEIAGPAACLLRGCGSGWRAGGRGLGEQGGIRRPQGALRPCAPGLRSSAGPYPGHVWSSSAAARASLAASCSVRFYRFSSALMRPLSRPVADRFAAGARVGKDPAAPMAVNEPRDHLLGLWQLRSDPALCLDDGGAAVGFVRLVA